MATLPALVSSLDAELRRLGYKDSTMVWYRGCWRRMQEHSPWTFWIAGLCAAFSAVAGR